MKKVLITGKNSYIGNSVENWLMKEPGNYSVDKVDMKDESWKKKDFSPYDVVFHVAGIAHIKENKDNEKIYYKVNRDLAYETALKSKREGVGHFIFLSSMSVYGIENGTINQNTPLQPLSAYGKSKLEAENLIYNLNDFSFKLAIIRPPMVYGRNCKGNYPKLASLAIKTPVFPKIDNKRSMIYIDNLSEFIKLLIDSKNSGLFFPQNTEFVNTSNMVKTIADIHGKKIRMYTHFNFLINILKNKKLNKLFGNLTYDRSMSNYVPDYRIVNFIDSLKKTELESNNNEL